MPEDKKIEIREALTKHYFGNHVEEHRAQTLLDPALLKELIELVKAARK